MREAAVIDLRPGDKLPPGEWKTSDGRTFASPPRATNQDDGAVFTSADRVVQLSVRPFYQAVIVESQRRSLSLRAPPPDIIGQPVEWTLISLGMMQRIQRLITWESLVNDMRALLPSVVAVAQLGRVLKTSVIGAPVGWNDDVTRDAMLRLLDTGTAAGIPIPLTNRKDTVRVDAAASLIAIDKWQSSPEAMIRIVGPRGARALLRTYLALEVDPTVVPEVQTSTGETLDIDLAALAGHAPHNGTSVVAIGHRGTRLIALCEVHVMPTTVINVPRELPFRVPVQSSPGPFTAFAAHLKRISQSPWNNYNMGWRGQALYALSGLSQSEALRSFNNKSSEGKAGAPFGRALAPADAPYQMPHNQPAGLLILSVIDFGADPFLAALIGPAAQWNAPTEPGSTFGDSFAWPTDLQSNAVLIGWAPRRIQGGVFVLPLTPSAEPEEESGFRVEAVQSTRILRDVLESLPLYQRDVIVPQWKEDLVGTIAMAANEPSAGKLRGDRKIHLFTLDNKLPPGESRRYDLQAAGLMAYTPDAAFMHHEKTIPLAAQPLELRENLAGIEKLEIANKHTYLDFFRQNPLLQHALQAADKRGPRVLPLLREADRILAFPFAEPNSIRLAELARTVVESLLVKVMKLRQLARTYRAVPAVDDDLTFDDIMAGPVARANPTLAQADREFLLRFARADLGLIWIEMVRVKRSMIPAAFADIVAAAARPVAPLPPSGVSTTVSPMQAGWAFFRDVYPQLMKAISALPLASGLDKRMTFFLRDTGLLESVKNIPDVAAEWTPAKDEYIRKGWAPLETIPGGAVQLSVLARDLSGRPPVISTSEAAVVATGLPAALGQSPAEVTRAFSPAQPIPLETIPGGATLLAALDRLQTSQSAAAAAEEAERRQEEIARQAALSQLRARVQDLFPGLKPTDDELEKAKSAGLETLVPLQYIPGGEAAVQALSWLESTEVRVQQADVAERQQLSEKARSLGLPESISTAFAGATKEERKAFLALKPIDPLAELHLSEALRALPSGTV